MPFQRSFTSKRLIKAVSKASTTATGKVYTGSTVDLQSYINPGGREMKAILDAAVTATSSLAVKMQETDGGTSTSWSDISGAAFTTLTSTGGHEDIHFRTNKRYVRALATVALCKGMQFQASLIVENRLT